MEISPHNACISWRSAHPFSCCSCRGILHAGMPPYHMLALKTTNVAHKRQQPTVTPCGSDPSDSASKGQAFCSVLRAFSRSPLTFFTRLTEFGPVLMASIQLAAAPDGSVLTSPVPTKHKWWSDNAFRRVVRHDMNSAPCAWFLGGVGLLALGVDDLRAPLGVW